MGNILIMALIVVGLGMPGVGRNEDLKENG